MNSHFMKLNITCSVYLIDYVDYVGCCSGRLKAATAYVTIS